MIADYFIIHKNNLWARLKMGKKILWARKFMGKKIFNLLCVCQKWLLI